jgi:hypothetical protein
MKLPYFNFDNLPVHPKDNSYLCAIIAEQKRVCGPIDERLRELGNEFAAMVDELNAFTVSLDTAKGFLERWSIRTKMRNLANKISLNRDMRYDLVCARITRTYA